MSEYIPIYEYLKLHDTSKQNVYRWIREGKFKADDVIEEEVKVKRLRIKATAKPA